MPADFYTISSAHVHTYMYHICIYKLHVCARRTTILCADCLLRRFGFASRHIQFGWSALWVATIHLNRTVCILCSAAISIYFSLCIASLSDFAERLLCNKLLCVCVRQLFTFHVACCSLLQLTYTNCHLCDIFAKLLCSLLLGAKQIAPKALSGEQRRIFLSDTWRQLFDLAIFNIC